MNTTTLYLFPQKVVSEPPEAPGAQIIVPDVATLLDYDGVRCQVTGWLRQKALPVLDGSPLAEADLACYGIQPLIHGQRLEWCERSIASFLMARCRYGDVVIPLSDSLQVMGRANWSKEMLDAAQAFALSQVGEPLMDWPPDYNSALVPGCQPTDRIHSH